MRAVAQRGRQRAARLAAQREHRDARIAVAGDESFPAQRGGARVRRRFQHRAQHREVRADFARVHDFGVVVGGYAHQRPGGQRRAGGQAGRVGAAQVHAVGFLPPCGGMDAVDQQAGARGAAAFQHGLQHFMQRTGAHAVRPLRFAQLHQFHAARQRGLQAAQERGHARARADAADAVGGGQLQPAQRRQRGGQQVAHRRRLGGIHPFQALVFQAARFAFPARDVAERQAHGGVRVGVHVGDPGARLRDSDADFFLQFARQRLQHGFARFELAARQFPPAGPGLAFRALAQQQHAVRAQDQAGGDVDDLLRHAGPPSRARIGRPRGPSASRARSSTAGPRCATARSALPGSPVRAASGRRCPGSRPA
ncbi:hypothetical protein D9M72_128060 [compost metagenome]